MKIDANKDGFTIWSDDGFIILDAPFVRIKNEPLIAEGLCKIFHEEIIQLRNENALLRNKNIKLRNYNKNEIYEYDGVTKHLFCKVCGNNFLMKKHKEDCIHYISEDEKYDKFI